MSIHAQRIFPGRLKQAFSAEVARLLERRAVSLLWAKRPELWTHDPGHARLIAHRLGWLDAPHTMLAEVERLRAFACEVAGEARHVVVLGMGGSSLAPEVFSLSFPAPPGMSFSVLDSTVPAAVLAAERAVDLRRTLFLVASKSGTTIETLSQFRYFYARVEAAAGQPAGRNFIAITDPSSPLEALARERSFRHVFLNPSDIGGRYSALSYFGLVPAALWQIDLDGVLQSALAMREACGPAAAPEVNPALQLGALLGAAAAAGLDKLFLLATPRLAPLTDWIEQLVAESTGKEGKGIVPAAREVAGSAELYAEGCSVATLAFDGDERSELDRLTGALERLGVPLVDIRLSRGEDLGGEFFKWEAATAIAGAVLGVNPFDEPNVKESKDNTARILAQRSAAGILLASDALLNLFAGSAARHRLAASSLSEALRGFFALRRPGDYLALLAFLPRAEPWAGSLDAIRLLLRDRLRLPVLVGYGPRYLHSIGQLYKGGPAAGLFLMITAEDPEDLPVPEAGYTFGALKMAQAHGDFEALDRRGKPVIRVHLAGLEAGLERLRQLLVEAA